MPRTTSISKLPYSVLTELQQRLVSSGFSDFESHAVWLNDQGFQVSRSAIHRYAMANSAAMLAGASNIPAEVIEARLRCLEIASSFATVKSATNAIDEAKVLMKWLFKA